MKNLIEKIKKLLGMDKKSSDSSNGFTLIELLIVIAVIGILAAGLLVALDPADKIRQSQDAAAMQKVTQTASRIDQFALNTGGTIGGVATPGTIPTVADYQLDANGLELTNGGGYTYRYLVDAANNVYVIDVTGLRSKRSKNLVSPASTTSVRFVYTSVNGKTCALDSTATAPTNAYACP